MSEATQPLTEDDDRLLEEIEGVITYIANLDLPNVPEDDRRALAGHLTGAIYVTLRSRLRAQTLARGTMATDDRPNEMGA